MLMPDSLQNILATSSKVTLDSPQNIADINTTATGSSWRQEHIPDSLQNVGTGEVILNYLIDVTAHGS
jgi:hypothetical protein